MMSKVEKPYVLVVDDNAEVCTLLTAILRRDFVAEIANDGVEAIERLRTKHYSAILLDLRMPQLDGFSVLDFLKESQPEMLKRVIVVTAILGAREIARVRAYDICRIVAKPFDVETLLADVKECVDPNAPRMGGVFCTPMILLLAEMLQKKLM